MRDSKAWLISTCVMLPSICMGDACEHTSVTVLGSGGPELNDDRASSSYLISQNDRPIVMLDAGSGSSFNFDQLGYQFNDIEAILLTHLHTDHSADLPAYIKGSYFISRTSDLTVAGPTGNDIAPSTEEWLTRLFGDNGAYPYLGSYLQKGQEQFTLLARSVRPEDSEQPQSSITGTHWKADAFSVPHGPFNALAWRVTIEDCVIVYPGDMASPEERFIKFALGADLLILHAAIPESASAAAKQLHMTPSQLSDIARELRPQLTLISHIMRRTPAQDSDEFMGLPEAVRFAEDGLTLRLSPSLSKPN